MKLKLESRLLGGYSYNLRYEYDTTFMKDNRETKEFLMKVKRESEKAGLKLKIQKMNIMASCPITLLKIDGETM